MPEEDSFRRPLLHSIAIVKAFVLSIRLNYFARAHRDYRDYFFVE